METSSPFNPVSPQAQAISSIFVTVLIIGGVVFLIVTVLTLYASYRFRHRGEEGEPKQVYGHRGLEIAWTITPGLLLAVLFVLTVINMQVSDPPVKNKQDPDITVIAHQWWWELHYPKVGIVTANELHIPIKQKLLLLIKSADVIHSFWVPRLARKMDAIPGHPNYMWLQADEPGRYWGTCSEYCGVQHAGMHILVIAESDSSYQQWQNEQQSSPDISMDSDAGKGMMLFSQLTCINCHAINNIGPNLNHVGSRETLAAGVLKNTPENMARWLRDPQKVKPGCHMPDMKLSDQQVKYLTAYMEVSK